MIGELVGYFIDVTRTVDAQANDRSRSDIAAAAASRGPIDQAKGVIAATFAVDPDESFQLLRHASNDRNIPVRELALLVVDEATHDDCAQRVANLLARPGA